MNQVKGTKRLFGHLLKFRSPQLVPQSLLATSIPPLSKFVPISENNVHFRNAHKPRLHQLVGSIKPGALPSLPDSAPLARLPRFLCDPRRWAYHKCCMRNGGLATSVGAFKVGPRRALSHRRDADAVRDV